MGRRLIAAFSAFTLLTIGTAQAEMPTTMDAEWKYDELVTATGENLDGDEPDYKKLCIVSETATNDRTCYDPDADGDGMAIKSWTNNSMSFFPPKDIPVRGTVVLVLRTEVEKCFGSAGCDMYAETTEKEIGAYTASPFVTDLFDIAGGREVFELKAGTTYRISGAFFGDGPGTIYLHFAKGPRVLDSTNVLEWSFDEIVFKTDAGEAPIGFSVNNGVSATKYTLSKLPISSSSSSRSQTTTSSSGVSKSSAAAMPLFLDVRDGHPYQASIEWAKSGGIVQGYADGTFQPDRIVNRAEFLKLMLVAKNINGLNTGDPTGFKDVDESAWYMPYVRYAKAKGIVQGYADGTFKPEQVVNFAEALKMAYNVLGVSTADIGGQWYARFSEHARLNGVLFNNNAALDAGMSRKDVVWTLWKLSTHTGDWQLPSALPPSRPPQASIPHFNDGTFVVGTEIEPGTYRTRKAPALNCYFERLSGFSGTFDDINANGNADVPTVVMIAETDAGFKSSGCGTWTQDLSAVTQSKTSFGNGTFIVGTDISPGTYKNTGGTSCYYERLRGFSHTFSDIIANENTEGSAIVTIDAGDIGFSSARCGTWTKIK